MEMRIDIARYSIFRAFFQVILGLAVVAFIFGIPLFSMQGHYIERTLSHGNFWELLIIIAWLFGIYTLLLVLAAARQLLFDEGRAVWIEDGNLVFLHRWYFSVACRKIVSVSSGTFGLLNQKAVVIHTDNGGEKLIPTGSLSEPRSDVISKLKIAIESA